MVTVCRPRRTATTGDDADEDSGTAWLILGAAPLTSAALAEADAVYTGEEEYDLAGWAVAAAADVNGDGFGDVLVGAIHNDTGAGNAGAA